MENNIKLLSGFNSNSYIRQFQIAQQNFYLFDQEEKLTKKRMTSRSSRRRQR